nr:outer membrane beta-barrel protein [uncultured Chryseobacterium sp.]
MITRIWNVIFQISCLLFAGMLYSQNDPLKFGIKAGWNYSSVNAIDETGQPSGYVSGIIDEIYGGFVFEKQISKKSFIQISPTVSFTDDITFIELPVYYKYNFYKRFSLLAGGKLNYIPDEQYNNFNYFSKRFGISTDIGIDYKLSEHFTLEGTFSKGFSKQFNQLALTYYEARRDVYRIGVIYFF